MVKRNLIPVILITSCMAVICFILLTYYQEDTEYEELKRRVITKETGQEKEKKNWLKIDWDALPKDCIAWIHFRHPKVISYPVMQGKDNGVYLHRDYKGDYSYSGSIFADSSSPALAGRNGSPSGPRPSTRRSRSRTHATRRRIPRR